MRFDFATANRILFGPGTIQEVGKIASGFGQRALIFTGVGAVPADGLIQILAASGVEADIRTVSGEPTTGVIEEQLSFARGKNFQMVIGLGGGSVIDTGKAIAALLPNPGELMDYLELVGKNQPFQKPPVPYIAIPTTAGTGSEVSRNAVISVPEHRMKISMRSPLMIPRVALVDPDLTMSAPPSVTGSTGMDALTQVLEPYVSAKRNPMTDLFCVDGMKRAARSLVKAYHNGNDAAAREDMAMTSLLGGLALANAGLGAVHGFASPIGGMFPAPHGAVCARLLPLVVAANLQALIVRAPESPILQRYSEVAQILTDDPSASTGDGVMWLQNLVDELNIPPLSTYGISNAELDDLVEKASIASSMQANPIRLTANELKSILEKAL
jgi:alcohol dehydrogenase class IV